jgi:hypothetical protein
VTIEQQLLDVGAEHDAEGPPGMAWQLVQEVLRSRPGTFTLAERAVLIALAEDARSATKRTTSMTRAELMKAADLSESGVRGALRRLRDRNLDPRVPMEGRKDRHGNPVYAVPGHAVTYKLPDLTALAPGRRAGRKRLPEVDEPEPRVCICGCGDALMPGEVCCPSSRLRLPAELRAALDYVPPSADGFAEIAVRALRWLQDHPRDNDPPDVT